MKNRIKNLLVVLLGNFIYALAVKSFLLPNNLMTGGTTGIALALNHYFGVSINGFVLIFNISMLVLGFVVLGKQFAATTVVSTFAYPLFLQLIDTCFGNVVLTNDILLATVFSGLGIGLALGLVIRVGASTGGMDIPPLVLNSLLGVNVSFSMYVFDFLILIVQILYNDINMTLYGIILVLIYTVVLDKVMLIGKDKIELKIVSNNYEAIRSLILHNLDRGVTMIDCTGGYLDERKQLVLSVVNNRELIKIERLIHNIDPEAFIIVSKVSEVRGHGFTLSKKYR